MIHDILYPLAQILPKRTTQLWNVWYSSRYTLAWLLAPARSHTGSLIFRTILTRHISPNYCIHLQVQVQILTGRRIHLLLDVQDTLDNVRDKIRVKEGIHPDQQVLLFNGIKLMDGTVEELCIQEGAVLFLTLRNRGG